MDYRVKKWQLHHKMDNYYRKVMVQKVSEQELMEWLKRNPPPDDWEGGRYFFALRSMSTGYFFTWWRRNILGWPV